MLNPQSTCSAHEVFFRIRAQPHPQGFVRRSCFAGPSFWPHQAARLNNTQIEMGDPWSQVKTNTPWVNPRLVKWGYVPFTHDSKNYYCLIEEGARTGSHVIDTTFMCGDPGTVQWLFQNNWRPSVPMIGGGPPLEPSLRPRPSKGN
jgi:hypothetical protein